MPLYLVTGAAGFIGSAIARALVERGEKVRGLDDLSTGNSRNLTDLDGRIDFRRGDLLDAAAVAGACRGADYVLHQAAIPSVPRSVEDPLGTNRVNVDGTVTLLAAAREAGVKRVVYAGSSSAYGDTPTLPKREDMAPSPISPYAVSKLAGEMYMASFWQVYGLETVTLRYFNIFGPRQDAHSQYSAVMAKFITLMLHGKAPVIYGDGKQSRDFNYIDNAVQANLLACTRPAAEVAGRVFNIAGGQRATINEIFQLLKKLTGFKGEAEYAPERAGDIKHSLADISLARKHLGYEPAVDLEEGLRRTVEWYRGQ